MRIILPNVEKKHVVFDNDVSHRSKPKEKSLHRKAIKVKTENFSKTIQSAKKLTVLCKFGKV